MLNKLEDWLLNVMLGKMVARGAVLVVGYVASAPAQALLAKAGVQVQIDPKELAAGMMLAANWVFEWFKARRMASPNSPAVQTDASKAGAVVPVPNDAPPEPPRIAA